MQGLFPTKVLVQGHFYRYYCCYHYHEYINRKYKCEIKINDNDDKEYDKNVLTMILQELKNVKSELVNVKNKNTQMQNKIDKLQNKNKILLKDNTLKYNYNKINVNGDINPITNINVVAFGKEKIDFVIEDLGKICQGNKTISNYVNYVHFNKNRPENHNIYMPSKKNRKEVFVFDQRFA